MKRKNELEFGIEINVTARQTFQFLILIVFENIDGNGGTSCRGAN
jgi:hypothetical protein